MDNIPHMKMQKCLVFVSLATVILTGCSQDAGQANLLNTSQMSRTSNPDIQLPQPQETEMIVDDEDFFTNERKHIIANMQNTLARIKVSPGSDDVRLLYEDQQKLLMTNPYEKAWQNLMGKLQAQLIELEVMVQDKKDGLERSIDTINKILVSIAT